MESIAFYQTFPRLTHDFTSGYDNGKSTQTWRQNFDAIICDSTIRLFGFGKTFDPKVDHRMTKHHPPHLARAHVSANIAPSIEGIFCSASKSTHEATK